MKLKFHVPTQQYGFLEIEGEPDGIKEMESLYNKYAEVPLIFKDGMFEQLETFTGEQILYNDDTHKYKDLDGNILLSGSVYKKSFDKPFDLENISKAVAKKHGVPQQTVKDMWAHNSSTSIFFGNALHNAMDQWFKFRETGTEKEYHLPKHPFLREVIDSFPLKDENILSEVLVSDIESGRVGQIDGLQITGKKKCNIIDYKTDAKVEDNVGGHFRQLSFYAHILMAFGWEVEKLSIWNYTTEWREFESPVLDLE